MPSHFAMAFLSYTASFMFRFIKQELQERGLLGLSFWRLSLKSGGRAKSWGFEDPKGVRRLRQVVILGLWDARSEYPLHSDVVHATEMRASRTTTGMIPQNSFGCT
jgi:hypothetical protein